MHTPWPKIGGPHDPTKAWGRGTNSPKVSHPPGVATTLWSPSHPGGWLVTPSSHKDPFFCCACSPAPERSVPQEPLQGPSAGTLRAPDPRASTPGFVRPATWGTWGAEDRAGAAWGAGYGSEEGDTEPEPQPRWD